jgi:hypothetical protein
MADTRLFRSADEAISHHRGAVENRDQHLFGVRIWQDFHEANPGIDHDRLERLIAQHWDELERMPTKQAMEVLARAAGGRRHQAPEPPAEVFDPNAEMGLGQIIRNRKEVRRQFSVVNPKRRTVG